MSRRGGRLFLPAVCLLGVAVFSALGIWQLDRREWKIDLIARVERRLAADPVELPQPSRWRRLEGREIEYRRVTTRGRLFHDRETLVDAVTVLGPGFWVMTPLRTSEETVLINRGFVPPERKAREARPESQLTSEVTVVGLVRLSEPKGRILRSNIPAEERWYSRDVAEIARARDLSEVEPFFIDADSAPNPGGYPVGGLTVVQFRNSHLAYALTWFSLALISLAGLVLSVPIWREGEGRRMRSKFIVRRH